MAFQSSKSNRCPVCVAFESEPHMVEMVDHYLAPLREELRTGGAIPQTSDKRFVSIALEIGIPPASLRFHLKNCLLDFEIQSTRLQELKDVVQMIGVAKQEYLAIPSDKNAGAYNQLMATMMTLMESVEEQQDPESAVTFMIEGAMNPLIRNTLAAMTEEFKQLRSTILPYIPTNQQRFFSAQINSALQKIGNKMQEAKVSTIDSVADYYKVQLDAKEEKRMLLSGGTSLGPDPMALTTKKPDPEPEVIDVVIEDE